MTFKEFQSCSEKPGIPALCEACLSNRDLIANLLEENKQLKEEIEVDNAIIAERDRLMDEIPGCFIHGNRCVPHAINWVKDMVKLENEKGSF
jgi:hypothetical protein